MSEAFKCDSCGEYFDGKPARVLYCTYYTPDTDYMDKMIRDATRGGRYDVCKNCDKVGEVEE